MNETSQAERYRRGATTLSRSVRFDTPAFLGDARQQAQWRTPPFKALLRQWWRVRQAPEVGYDAQPLSAVERQLFGFAGNKSEAQRSRVQLRLDRWDPGTLEQLHPANAKVGRVDARLYLGYGAIEPVKETSGIRIVQVPVDTEEHKEKQERPNKRPIRDAAQETNRLSLRLPHDAEQEIVDTLTLIDWFGTLGNRSRNGWGSLALSGPDDTRRPLRASDDLLTRVSRQLTACLDATTGCDWPHAIGCDATGVLVWQTEPLPRWEEVMQTLTRLKQDFRRQAGFGKDKRFHDGHLLAYPVTQYMVPAWQNARLPNQLRFKIVRVADDGKTTYIGRIFHLPARLPASLAAKLGDQAPSADRQLETWQRVIGTLDESKDVTRLGEVRP